MRLPGLSRSRSLAIPLFVAAVNLALTFHTQFTTLGNFPNSGDEYAYLVSAEIFARGRLSVPSPEPRQFFDVMHVVNDGRFYGKYPPGWSALLAPGVVAGVPWLVNPLLGLAALLAVYALARRHFSIEVANTACLLLLGNPFLVFNAASWFPHTACLLLGVLFTHFLFVCIEKPGDVAASLLMGLAAGLAFTMRPFTIVTLAAVPTFYLLAQLGHAQRRRAHLRGLLLAALPFAACLAALLAYNHSQTGDAFLNPFEMYAGWDAPGLPKDDGGWVARLSTHLWERSWELGRWMPLSPLLLLAAACLPATRKDPKVRVFLLASATLFVAFFFYWGGGGFRYGPRYVHEAAGMVAIVSALVLVEFGRSGLALLAMIVAVNAVVFDAESTAAARVIYDKQDLYRQAREKGLRDAVVFVRNGSGMAPLADMPRNGIDFDATVLYVRDRGAANMDFRRAYPHRRPWVYTFDYRRWRGSLVPYGPTAPAAAPGSTEGPGSASTRTAPAVKSSPAAPAVSGASDRAR